VGMSEGEAGAKLREAAARLDQIAAELRSGQTEDATAVKLAQEAAQIAADVGAVTGEAARSASVGGDGVSHI
ncbi:MAG: hypothetical protein JJE23_12060, partial [Thermoleophilia bacterium]|nr:hypothetical protein [Thermoleophilia bacterium]